MGFSLSFLKLSTLYVIATCDTILGMETVQTIVCKLDPSPEQVAGIEATLKAFADACNHIAGVARREHTTNKVKLQHVVYKDVREQFGLSANLTIRAIARVCAALKVPARMHSVFTPTSIDYDQRIFSFREWDWTFSLTLLYSRQRLNTVLGDWQKNRLRGRKPTSATLVKRRDGGYCLHVQIKDQAPEPSHAHDHLGVDLGIVNIATDSDQESEPYSGQPVEDVRRKHNLQRKRLQKRNTKGAKKKLRRIAGKEARFKRHVNHVISKKVVDTARRTGRGIALEELRGIRGRIRARGSDARNRLSGWSFHQLSTFILYKALAAGVAVVFVDPAYTSQTCSVCGYCARGNRKTQSEFVCLHCGHYSNADKNAARNIRLRAQAVCNPALELAGFAPSRKAAEL